MTTNLNRRLNELPQVLRSLTWTIREGDRWHLIGPNGSGKTTLTSLIRGEHPQSFTQSPPSSHLRLFGKRRNQIPTITLQKKIGLSSPEIFASFPRRSGPGSLTVRDAIATGFDGTFAYRRRTQSEEETLDALIRGPLGKGTSSEVKMRWANQEFASIPPGEQSLVLFMRAIVGSPPLVILDETFIGMDDLTLETVKGFLTDRQRSRSTAIIVMSHEDFGMDGFRKYVLKDGEGRLVEGDA